VYLQGLWVKLEPYGTVRNLGAFGVEPVAGEVVGHGPITDENNVGSSYPIYHSKDRDEDLFYKKVFHFFTTRFLSINKRMTPTSPAARGTVGIDY
jgi:hypothetical protein